MRWVKGQKWVLSEVQVKERDQASSKTGNTNDKPDTGLENVTATGSLGQGLGQGWGRFLGEVRQGLSRVHSEP